MSDRTDPILDCPVDQVPDPAELIQAAMGWHFSPETGSPFWLERAKTLEFDPRRDVRTFEDLRLFPNVVNELRYARAEDLIPKGYGGTAKVAGVFESGGTTGAPKRMTFLADWIDRWFAWSQRNSDARGYPIGINSLVIIPTGPHMFGYIGTEQTRRRGGIPFTIDMDPRWVKRCIAEGRAEEADRYVAHLVGQARDVLETQDVGMLITTPPLLERLVRDDDVVKLINEKVKVIIWGGAHMDADTRHLFRTDVFPDIFLQGGYGNTMMMGSTVERMGLSDDEPCIFDTFSPHISLSVIDPETGKNVAYGERGQVVTNHISKNALLPNNLERDLATRIEPAAGNLGDAVADVSPVATFENEAVIEGVY